MLHAVPTLLLTLHPLAHVRRVTLSLINADAVVLLPAHGGLLQSLPCVASTQRNFLTAFFTTIQFTERYKPENRQSDLCH
jgi:hypothetical protein